uniref:Uncharacterized protein n=1 Tax=Leviviridae sp. TaxID=2027243 RepID=A0A514CZ22_9VIRU|nr:MAG: hypothetical protein H2Bulk35278_000002 [Leviviridae sp.]
MAFSDPQTVTINAVAQTLPRISTDATSSVYQKDDSNVKLTIQQPQPSAKRWRRVARLDHRKIAADPFAPALNASYNMDVYLVVDSPKIGYTLVEQKQIVDALIAYLSASSGAQITKLLGGEN